MPADPLDGARDAIIRGMQTTDFRNNREMGLAALPSSFLHARDLLGAGNPNPKVPPIFMSGYDPIAGVTVEPFTADWSTCDGPDVCVGTV